MGPTAATAANALWAWQFQRHLDELKGAYKAARSEADRERERQINAWDEFEKKVDAGESSLIQEDEDGQVIWDAGDDAHEKMHEIEMVLGLVREAFTISLHHLLERQVNKRMKRSNYDEQKAFAFLRGKGMQPDEPILTILRLTANVAKHSGGSSAQQLHRLRPDLFDNAEMARWSDPPSYEYLRITDQILNVFFDAVRRSGPQRKKGWG
jgi:hypothetical protein